MNDKAKIPFSLAEMQLIENAGIFLTKRRAFDHSIQYLSKLQIDIEAAINQNEALHFIKEEFCHRKISHGESYKLMPYQVSDFPAKFAKNDILTIRCLVWWGNEVSIHFLLQGDYYKKYYEQLKSNSAALPSDFYGCVAERPWEHHFLPDNYLPIHSFLLNQDAAFCKIGKKYALSILTKGTQEIVSDVLSLLKLLIKV